MKAHLTKHLQVWNEVLSQKSILAHIYRRLFMMISIIGLAFLLIIFRLTIIMVFSSAKVHRVPETPIMPRADILDRRGEILATHLFTTSLYANPKHILNAKEATEKIHLLFPHEKNLYKRLLDKKKTFVWVARHVSPRVLQKFYNLGIPGIYTKKDTKRVYPAGNLCSHIVGYCGVDGEGLAGVEKTFNASLKAKTLKLSLDLRVQHIVREELLNSISTFQADGANAIVMHKSGQIIASVSLPDFNPNFAHLKITPEQLFNRNTLGTYEPGSTFKIINVAISLSEGKSRLETLYDARNPVRIGRFTVSDFRGKARFLTLKEAFIYSSNIAAIKIAQQFGRVVQQKYFKKFELFNPIKLEIPELGRPHMPKSWSDTTLMTAAYGYGVSVTPLHLLTTVHGLVQKGQWVQPTLLLKETSKKSILNPRISLMIRSLMRAAAIEGGAKKANIEGYDVFGKTGTAYMNKCGRYLAEKSRMTSFVGGFPEQEPEYMLLVMLENPKAVSGTYGFAAAGWNAAPTAGNIIKRIAPLLGVMPEHDGVAAAA